MRYLNNLVEQDHAAAKRILRPVLGFKSFQCAHAIIAGIETMHMIKKGQLDFVKDRTLSAADKFYALCLLRRTDSGRFHLLSAIATKPV